MSILTSFSHHFGWRCTLSSRNYYNGLLFVLVFRFSKNITGKNLKDNNDSDQMEIYFFLIWNKPINWLIWVDDTFLISHQGLLEPSAASCGAFMFQVTCGAKMEARELTRGKKSLCTKLKFNKLKSAACCLPALWPVLHHIAVSTFKKELMGDVLPSRSSDWSKKGQETRSGDQQPLFYLLSTPNTILHPPYSSQKLALLLNLCHWLPMHLK